MIEIDYDIIILQCCECFAICEVYDEDIVCCDGDFEEVVLFI